MHNFIWDFDPILVSFKYIQIHWYGALFALALLSNYLFMHWVYLRELGTAEDVDRLLWYCMGGAVIGARLAHVLFYNPGYYFSEPIKIFAVWEGGLASHGGVFGVLISLYIYQRKAPFDYWWILDRAAIAGAFSGFMVRTGNFLNSEIAGTPADLPWAVVFKRIDDIPRHPVQLYEALSYLAISLFLLYFYNRSPTYNLNGRLTAWFLILIFSTRFILEFYKTSLVNMNSDYWISAGQILSIPFILTGIYILYRTHKHT